MFGSASSSDSQGNELFHPFTCPRLWSARRKLARREKQVFSFTRGARQTRTARGRTAPRLTFRCLESCHLAAKTNQGMHLWSAYGRASPRPPLQPPPPPRSCHSTRRASAGPHKESRWEYIIWREKQLILTISRLCAQVISPSSSYRVGGGVTQPGFKNLHRPLQNAGRVSGRDPRAESERTGAGAGRALSCRGRRRRLLRTREASDKND